MGHETPCLAAQLDLSRVLRVHDGSTVALLTGLSGQQVGFTVRRQSPACTIEERRWLWLCGRGRILRRRIELAIASTTVVSAVAVIALDRLPIDVREAVERGRVPLGTVLARRRIETYREPSELLPERQEGVIVRRYRIFAAATPIASITERFRVARLQRACSTAD
jgi:chorismate-pyruvate lyase